MLGLFLQTLLILYFFCVIFIETLRAQAGRPVLPGLPPPLDVTLGGRRVRVHASCHRALLSQWLPHRGVRKCLWVTGASRSLPAGWFQQQDLRKENFHPAHIGSQGPYMDLIV